MPKSRLCFIVPAALYGVMSLCAATSRDGDARDPNNPTGTAGLLAIDKRGGRIDFLDPVSHTLLQSIEVTKNPHELAISPDHTKAYVTIYGPGIFGANPDPGHSIVVVNLVTHTIVDTIDILPYRGPHGIMVDRAGSLYVTCDAIHKLLIIDPVNHRVKSVIDTESAGHWLALLPDASKAYISAKSDKDYVVVLDLRTKRIVQRITTPGGTEGIVSSPDGKRVIAAAHSRPSLYVIDTATDTVTDEVPLQGFPSFAPTKDPVVRVRFSPDGSKVLTDYYASGQMIVSEANDLRAQTLIAVGKGPMGFAFAADNHTALVANHDAGTVSVISLDGGRRYLGDFGVGEGIETLAFF